MLQLLTEISFVLLVVWNMITQVRDTYIYLLTDEYLMVCSYSYYEVWHLSSLKSKFGKFHLVFNKLTFLLRVFPT